ncbi:hypothetical protein LTR16_006711, partial [Cryomyces antarcticus]
FATSCSRLCHSAAAVLSTQPLALAPGRTRGTRHHLRHKPRNPPPSHRYTRRRQVRWRRRWQAG